MGGHQVSHCLHCCCHCSSAGGAATHGNGVVVNSQNGGDMNQNQSVTFSTNVTTVGGNGLTAGGNGGLKSALKSQTQQEQQQANGRNNKTEILISADQTSVISVNGTQPTSLTSNGISNGGSVNCNGGYRHENGGAGGSVAMKTAEPRVNIVSRPRPKSVAVPNPSSSGIFLFLFRSI